VSLTTSAPSSPIHAQGPTTIALVRGADALARMADDRFVGEWTALAARCPWATVFQQPAFVRAWCEVHRPVAEPLILEGRGADGALVGLLTLSRRGGRSLTHAGDIHAEYQPWLATPEAGEAFIVAALETLRAHDPRAIVRLAYLPPGTPLEWTRRPPWRGVADVRTTPRGLIDLDDLATIDGALRKKHNKSRLNRLGRFGEVRLERLTPPEMHEQLDQVALLCDVRQGGMNGTLPFADNRFKRPLHERMIDAGLFHGTVLRAGDLCLSYHLDVPTGDGVLLYLIVHDPRYAAQSPGTLHLLLLARLLAGEGVRVYDMSPGAGYKHRYVSRLDEVSGLVVRFRRRDRLVRRGVASAAGAARWATRRLGRDEAAMAETAAAAVAGGPRAMARAALALVRGRRGGAGDASGADRTAADRGSGVAGTALEIDDAVVVPDSRPPRLGRGRLEALLLAPAVGSGSAAREAFLGDALRRLEDDQALFTRVVDGVLVEVWWRDDDAGTIDVGRPGGSDIDAVDAIASLRELIGDARSETPRQWRLRVPPDTAAVRDAAFALGFRRVDQRGR
jgi:CelD/BcsL family acetyltransferase involved in cellulose biosynthesis